jgi:hypothetical protein
MPKLELNDPAPVVIPEFAPLLGEGIWKEYCRENRSG